MLPLLLWFAGSVAGDGRSVPERLIEAGHWKRARVLVEARLRESPNDAASTFLLSQIRAAFGDRTAPMPLAGKAVNLDDRMARYHRQLAEAIGVTAQHANAFQLLLLGRRFRKELDMALTLDPRDVQALRDLEEFYLVAPGIVGGDSRKAAEVAARIGAVDPEEGMLARARIAGFHHDAAGRVALLRQAADAQPPSYKALIELAQANLDPEAQNLDAAEAAASAAIRIAPDRVAGYSILAAVYAARGDWIRLDATLRAAGNLVPDDATPYFRAAERLLADGREAARAERYLRVYLGQEPEGNEPTHAEARFRLGLALEALGRFDEAQVELQEARRLDPESKAVAELKRLRERPPTRRAGAAGAR
jgi:tetratricopeptide (TPR) repeat protein